MFHAREPESEKERELFLITDRICEISEKLAVLAIKIEALETNKRQPISEIQNLKNENKQLQEEYELKCKLQEELTEEVAVEWKKQEATHQFKL